MTPVIYSWYFIQLVFYPLRMAIFYVHRFLVFTSKPGARLIVPIALLIAAFILRTRIDGIAGAFITDLFWDFRDTDFHDLYAYRIEICFGVAFFTLYLALAIIAKITTPIVGAFPAPRSPLMPMAPLIARKHVIKIEKATVAVGGKGSRYRGDLEQLKRFLPPAAIAVLEAGKGTPHEQGQSPEQRQQTQRERERQSPPVSPEPMRHEPALHPSGHNGQARRDEPKPSSAEPSRAAPTSEPTVDPEDMAARHEQQREGMEMTRPPEGRQTPRRPHHEPREAHAHREEPVVASSARRTPLPPKSKRRAKQEQPEPEAEAPIRRTPRRAPKSRRGAAEPSSPQRDQSTG